MADVVEVENQQTERRSPHGAGQRLKPRAGSRGRWLLLALVIVVAAGAYATWRYYSARESTDDAQIDGHITPISARVGGTVLAVHVNDNQYVEAGTVLVEIDSRDYQVAVESAQADLASEQAKARSAQTGVPITSTSTSSRLRGAQAGVQAASAALRAAQEEVSAARAQLEAAQARIRETEANHQKAGRDLDRMKQLIAKDEISQQQYDGAVAAEAASRAAADSARAEAARAAQSVPVAESHVAQAQAAVAQAQAGVDAARTGPEEVAVSRAQFGNAQAKIQQAAADVRQAQLNLEYATVRAPVSGAVSNKTVQVGQVVQPGQPLLAIVPLEDIWVTANFKETQLRKMRPGQGAIISVDAYGREYRGHVDSVAAATGARFSLLPPENASGNYVKVVQRIPVKILFEKGQDPQHLLRPGLSVEPTVLIK